MEWTVEESTSVCSYLQAVLHSRDETRGEKPIVQDVAQEQVTHDWHILLHHEVSGPLVHHLHLVVGVPVLQENFLGAHGEIEPPLDGSHVVPGNSKSKRK